MNLAEIKTRFVRLNAEKWLQIHGLVNGTIDPDEFASVQDWTRQCHSEPRNTEKVMCALNEVIGGFGVEAIDCPDVHVDSFHLSIVATYVNMGDTYDATIVYDTQAGVYLLTSWGDWYEDYQSEQEAIKMADAEREAEIEAEKADEEYQLSVELDDDGWIDFDEPNE